MGQRHARNLRKICVKRGLSCPIDLLRTCSADVPEGIRGVYTSKDQFPGAYDAVFITNPTAAHYETLVDLIDLSDALSRSQCLIELIMSSVFLIEKKRCSMLLHPCITSRPYHG